MLPSDGHAGIGLSMAFGEACPKRATAATIFKTRVNERAATCFITIPPTYQSAKIRVRLELPSTVNVIRVRFGLRERRAVSVTERYELISHRRWNGVHVHRAATIVVCMWRHPIIRDSEIKLTSHWQADVVQSDLSA